MTMNRIDKKGFIIILIIIAAVFLNEQAYALEYDP